MMRSREDHDVDLRVAKNQKDVLEHHRVAPPAALKKEVPKWGGRPGAL